VVLPVRLERQTAVGCRREIPAGFERGRRSPGAPRAPPPVVRPRGSRVRVALHARGVGQGRRRRREGETLRERIERERQLPVGGCPGCSVRKAQGLNAFCRTGRASPAYPRCPGGLPRRSRRRRARCRWRRLFWTAAAGSSAIRGVVTAIGCVRAVAPASRIAAQAQGPWRGVRHGRWFYNGRSGKIIVRHMCDDGLLSQPRPSFGCLKCRPMISMNGSIDTCALRSKE